MSSRPLVIVPYCVKNIGCKANVAERELFCERHACDHYSTEACGMYNILEEADKRGLRVRAIVSDVSLERIAREEEPEVILGVACEPRKERATDFFESLGIECHSISLDNETCFRKTREPSKYDVGAYVKMLDKFGRVNQENNF